MTPSVSGVLLPRRMVSDQRVLQGTTTCRIFRECSTSAIPTPHGVLIRSPRFPPTWPVYTPAHKLAGWLEYYAEAMELNVWTSSTVLKAIPDANHEWDVTVKRADGSERILHVRHVVSAIGLGGNTPYFPEIPGKEEYEGQVLHSIFHGSAKDHIGKKVFIVG